MAEYIDPTSLIFLNKNIGLSTLASFLVNKEFHISKNRFRAFKIETRNQKKKVRIANPLSIQSVAQTIGVSCMQKVRERAIHAQVCIGIK